MTPAAIRQQLTDIVGAWDGVTVQRHRHGGTEFRVHQREIGHVHDNAVADLLFSVRERRDLVASGRAKAHRTHPRTGWVSVPLETLDDLPAVIELMRRNYERLRGMGQRAARLPMAGNTQLVDDRYSGELPA